MLILKDRKSLDGHVQQQNERKKNWETYLEEEKSALQNEVLNHQDVILVNTTDVYQYLPSKILAFYEDVIQTFDFDFLLKTDDDSIVDVDTLVKLLQSEYSDQVPNRIWWGRYVCGHSTNVQTRF